MQYGTEPKHLIINTHLSNTFKHLFALFLLMLIGACSVTESVSTDAASNQENEPAISIEQNDELTGLVHPSAPVEVTLPEPDISTNNAESDIPADLWEHIANNLEFQAPQNQARFEEKKRWYLKHPNYMRTVTTRAKPFLYYIVEQFEAQDIPLDIVLLPIVESAFDPHAYSQSGAAGMWQFMPATGKSFNMPQNFWYDGRRDVIASTQGAIEYLKYLHKMFDGNWLHALAAYNTGEGRLLRAIRKNKRAGLSTDFWSLDLPRETRAYVPRLLALADILKNREEYQYNWPAINNAPVIEVVDVGSQIDLNIAAKFANISLKEMRALNPGYKEWATDPAGPHLLILPKDKVSNFSLALSNLPENERLAWHRHTVKSGDNIGELAQRYNISITALKRINKMRNNTIYIGDTLLVPLATGNFSENAEGMQLLAANIDMDPQSSPRKQNRQQYTVRSGDTLSEIAQIFDVSVRDLANWNKISRRATLSIGQRLTILTSDGAQGTTRELTYKVKSGDSLSEIASQFNVKVKDILRWNAMSKRDLLQIGQPIKLLLNI